MLSRSAALMCQIRMHWENFPLAVPYHQIGYWQSYATTQIVWTQEEKLKELACGFRRSSTLKHEADAQ